MHPTELTQKRELYKQALVESVRNIRDTLSQIEEVESAILFGSYAAGRRDLLTDLDIAVIMTSNRNFVERCAELRGRMTVSVDLDLLAYTPEEWARNKDRIFFKNIRETGKVIYAKKSP